MIPAGATCALVGRTGAGKTTVLQLLQRLYEPQTGRITIDGRDIREITQASLRSHIATVNQEVFLFHDTVYENIRYGRLDATRAEIENAARHAYAAEFIDQLPERYESVIGDKGRLLSGGQRQRLSIARALLKDAPILLLDEATSALDSESEKRIQAALDELAQGRTVLAIAHRLSTILAAEQIVLLDSGRILATGPHAALYEASPEYRSLYNLQFLEHNTTVPTSSGNGDSNGLASPN
jgi:subfamily B ATP-binding cassette protein MsbA